MEIETRGSEENMNKTYIIAHQDAPVPAEANKSSLLLTYLNKIDPITHPNDLCPLRGAVPHDTGHLFNCNSVPTQLRTRDLWENPVAAAALLAEWGEKLGARAV